MYSMLHTVHLHTSQNVADSADRAEDDAEAVSATVGHTLTSVPLRQEQSIT